MATVPPPGTIATGQLSVDAQTREIWMGIDPEVDPLEAILISDIVGTMAAIDAAQQNAQAYADVGLAAKSPVAHTHTIDQVQGLTAALSAASSALPPKTIVMWSGSLLEIGVGPLAGWALCNGSNGTPNLTDRFIIGSGGTKTHMSTGGTKDLAQLDGSSAPLFKTKSAGDHNHGGAVGNTALTESQIPAHIHGITTTGNGSDTVLGRTTSGGVYDIAGGGPSDGFRQVALDALSAGGSQAHTHTVFTAGIHTHGLEGTLEPPYFALAFIMKLP